MATYTLASGSLKVALNKSSFAPSDTVKVAVAYDVKKSGWTAGAWSINATVYRSSGKLLDKDGETNLETTTQSVSTLAAPVLHPHFSLADPLLQPEFVTPSGAYTIVIKVVLDADGVVLGSVYKSVYVAGEEAEEEEEGGEGKFTLASGSFRVKPYADAYNANETVKLAVAYDITKSGWAGEYTWSVNAEVYDAGGNLLDRDGETNAFTTARSISSLSLPTIHPQFKMSNADMKVKVKLIAVYKPTIYTAKSYTLGTVSLTIPLAGVTGETQNFSLLSGSFKVALNKASYEAGDTIKLYVGYDITRTGNVGISWSVNASVYDSENNLLDKDGETNALTTSRGISSADPSALVHPQFKASATMVVKVVLDADGVALGQATLTIPVSAAVEEGEEVPVENGEVGEGEEATIGGIPVKWLAIGVVGVLLLTTMGGKEGKGG